jgi:glycosyltransferase involved in cell wall biosynthesis
LYVTNGEHYSGAERVQDLLATHLPREGFEVGFACVKPNWFPRLRHHRASPLHELPMRSRLDFRVVGGLCRLVRRDDYRIIHAHTPRGALLGQLAARWTGVPFVYHVHSPACRDTTYAMRNRLNSFAERLSLWGAAKVIAVSSSLGYHMQRRGVPAARIVVVRNGVPSPPVKRGDGLPGPVWTLGAVALFRPRKGLEILLDALALLRRRDLPVRLRAVGAFETVDYEAHIVRRAEGLGLRDLVEWRGFRQHVAAELARMDLLVLPSLFGEGLPMVLLEAMAAGVPVVATRVEGVPEAVDDGVQGLLARPGDSEDLAWCIEQVIRGELDWTALRRNALSQHAERFSDRSMAAGVAEVYREVLARRLVQC